MNGDGVGAGLPVTYDDQVFVLSRRGGVARYFTELLREFDADPELGILALTPFRFVVNTEVQQLTTRRFRTPALPARALHPRVLHALNAIAVRRRSAAPLIQHYTHYSPRALTPPSGDRPAGQVCTVYDMTPELFPHLFASGNPHLAKDDYVHASDAILCISQTTKNDVLKHYGQLDKPVVVTPLGVSSVFQDATARSPIPEPYVLFVGQREAYKNFAVLLDAFAQLIRTRPSLHLLCVGGPEFRADEILAMAELGVSDRVTRRVLTDGELAGAYAAAAVFVFPSLYEGFGLPTVEAFAAGCPVILADTPCSTEIGADAALFFSPADVDGLAQLIDLVVGDHKARARAVQTGRVRAQDFSWRHTAELTAAAYQQVAARIRTP